MPFDTAMFALKVFKAVKTLVPFSIAFFVFNGVIALLSTTPAIASSVVAIPVMPAKPSKLSAIPCALSACSVAVVAEDAADLALLSALVLLAEAEFADAAANVLDSNADSALLEAALA